MAFNKIQCSPSTITVGFSDKKTMDGAQESWTELEEFFIITSHPGCNEDGERAPYLYVPQFNANENFN